jgi:multidrug efflux system outer membrane protein
LFDGGRNAAGVDASVARKNIAVAEYERTIQLAFREVSDQLSARASLTAQMRATRANANSQEIRLNMAKSRYDLGAIAYFEVIDAQREYLASQQALTGVRRAQVEAAVQLYKALGGGAQGAGGRRMESNLVGVVP